MWALVAILVGGTVIALIVGYLHQRSVDRKVASGRLASAPEVKTVDATCCGQHAVCEKRRYLDAFTREVEYYDDEALDRFAGRDASDYDTDEVEEFREVLYTCRVGELTGWTQSLQRRGIAFPDALRDELLLLLDEAGKSGR